MIITIDLSQPLSNKDQEILFAILDRPTAPAESAPVPTPETPPAEPAPTPAETAQPAPVAKPADVAQLTEQAAQTALRLIDQGKTDLVRAALIASGVARVSDLDTIAKHDLFSKFLEEQETTP